MNLARRSEAALALGRIGDHHGEIAARLGCARQAVNHWINGERVPSPKYRRLIKRFYKIDVSLWDSPPKSRAAHAAATANGTAAPANESVPVSLEDISVFRLACSLEAEVKRSIAKACDATHPLTEGERAKVLRNASATLSTLSRITGDALIIDEQKLLRLPAWRHIESVIARVFAKYPETAPALKELGGELVKLGGGA